MVKPCNDWKGLLVRPAPIPNESARGYLIRCCERNGLGSPRWLLASHKERGIVATGYAGLSAIFNNPDHAFTGVRGHIANLAQLNAPDPKGLPIRYWNTRQPRFCPACLEESAHWRANWDIVFVVACDKHGLHLHDLCPACGEALSWNRPHVATCACGFELRNAVPETASGNAVLLAREIGLRLKSDVELGNDGMDMLRTLDMESLLRLVWFLGAYSRNAHRKPQKVVGLETVAIATAMVDSAVSILSDWPAGFHRLLDEIAARQKPATSNNKLGARFGNFYGALYKSFPGSEFEFLRRGFEEYLRANWAGQLAKRNKRLSIELRTAHEWVSIAEAARLLNMRTDKVRHLIESGQIEGNLHETKCGRKMSTIRRDSLDSLISRRQDLVTLKEARGLLGISRKRAYALLEQGLLKPVSGPTVDGQTLWSFSRQGLLSIECLGKK